LARIAPPSPLPMRFRVECGPLNWRLRGLLVAAVAAAAAIAPYEYSLALPLAAGITVDVIVVAAAAAVSLLSGPLASAAYALSHASTSTVYTVVAAAAAAVLLRRGDPAARRLVETLQAEALPRPAGLAAAAVAAALAGYPALPGGAAALYAGFAASLAPSTLEAVVMGFLGGLHPAAASALGAYLASSPHCYRCSEGVSLDPARLVGVYRRSQGFTCAVGDAVVAAVYRPLLIVLGSYGVELARRIAGGLGAELIVAVGREEYEDALRRAAETVEPVVIASTYLPETVLPPAPGRDTAIIVSGVRDPVYLEKLAKSLKVETWILEVFASKPGLAAAYPGCHGELLLLEWGAR